MPHLFEPLRLRGLTLPTRIAVSSMCQYSSPEGYATDWIEGGWDIEQSVVLVHQLEDRGVDLVDCSSRGSSPAARIPFGPGSQVPFADRIRRETGMMVGAVGTSRITPEFGLNLRGGALTAKQAADGGSATCRLYSASRD
ncbi:MAG: hypothetical protein LAO21_05015 [Acidobacteriia bacterium]|nr:hypothetical protein [Terriglobia bacterium]